MSTILDTIVERKKEEVAELRKIGIRKPKEMEEVTIDPPRGFINALVTHQDLSVIAEVKKASPSKGIICHDFDPVKIAKNYQESGAQAISVLTDKDFFKGDLLYMMQVRRQVSLPVIRKDFMIDELQIKEASHCGADAILLIAAILETSQIKDFQALAAELGMDSLVEVHDEKEAEMAMEAGAKLIGVNNRNLKDFSVDINTSLRMRKIIPSEIPMVSESGLQTSADLQELIDNNICAALIGETLMRMGTGKNVIEEMRGNG
ncbi:MAG: indole-3-glycerol phosphate synthase TrpC [Desulfotalea sp.]